MRAKGNFHRTNQVQFRAMWHSLPSEWRQKHACAAFFGDIINTRKGSVYSRLSNKEFTTWFTAFYHPNTLTSEEQKFFKQKFFLGKSATLEPFKKPSPKKRKREQEKENEREKATNKKKEAKNQ